MSNVQFLALDISLSCTGLAILSMTDDNKFVLHSKNSIVVPQKKNKTRFERKYDIYNLFKYYLEQNINTIKFAVLENYAFAAKGQLLDLAEVSALYKLALTEFSIPFDVLPPKSSKLIVAGSGNASKQDVANALPNFLINYNDFSFNSLDETDAIGNGIAYAIKMIREVSE